MTRTRGLAVLMTTGSIALAACTSSNTASNGGQSGGSMLGGSAGGGGSGGRDGGGAGGSTGGAGAAGTGGTAGTTGGSAGTTGGTGGNTGGTAGLAGTAGGMAGAAGGMAGAAGGMAGAAGMVATDSFVYASGGDAAIEGFRFDDAGKLTSIGKFPSTANPTYLSFHPGGLNVYASHEVGQGTIQAYAIERGSGKLTALMTRDSGGSGAVHNSVHPSGKWLFVSNYNQGNVRVFPLTATGDIGPETDTKMSGGESHQIVVDPTGKFAFVPCRGPNTIIQFKFDDQTGKLTPNTPPSVAQDDPRHIAFAPGGKFAYLVNENPANVVSFKYDATAGTLSDPQKIDLMAGEDWGSHVVVSPDGKFVFVGGRKTGRIFWYTADATTGRLTPGGSTADGIQVPRDFTISRDGKFLVVANQSLGSVIVLRIGANGTLTKVADATKTVADPAAVVVVPVPKP